MAENRKTAQGSKLKAESKNLKAEGTRYKAMAQGEWIADAEGPLRPDGIGKTTAFHRAGSRSEAKDVRQSA